MTITKPGDDAFIFVTAALSFGEITRGFGEADEADNKLEQFRILAFKSNGTLAYNAVTDISDKESYKVELATGTYHFVFIGNEDYEANSALTSQLESLTIGSSTLSDVAALSFPAKAFDSSINIPMSRIVKNVKILGDSRYEIEGQEHNNVWTVTMKRLGVRLDIKLTTDSYAKTQSFTKLNIKNIPISVPILEEDAAGNTIYNGGPGKFQTTPKVILKSEGDNGGSFAQPSTGEQYQWTVTRVILPSSVFESDTEANALTLECVHGSETSSAALETKLDDLYQVPRNTHIKATMSFAPAFEIYITAEDWDLSRLNSIVGATRDLNVSQYNNISITQGTRARVWFSSNMQNVHVYATTSVGQQVNNYFKDLAGTGATNCRYVYDSETKTGSGYLDIMTSDNYNGGNNRYRIYLNASGLMREITIDVVSGGAGSDKIGYFEYVGAFWRNSQKGERVITGESSGAWRAEIEYGREWAVIGPGKSMDEKIYTSNPGDAEDYPVDGDEYVVVGTGQVFFRIGAKSTQPEGSQPRYGRIKLTNNNSTNTAYIYLRQGEEADYLMRPSDPDGMDPRYTRELAAKFSPFNITSTSLKSGNSSHSRIGVEQGVEVEYPSQAGAFFHWAENSSPVYAYNPVSPTGTIQSFGSTASQDYWGNIPSQDVCPPNYRRPKNGLTTNTTSVTATLSEFAQSMCINQTAVVSGTSTANCSFGYYADGFFDRRQIQEPQTNASNMKNPRSAVMPTSTNVAYSGCLFYNPDESYNASIFFPCPGERFTGGVLRYTGRDGYYLTDTANSTTSGHALYIKSPGEKQNYVSRLGTTLKVGPTIKASGNSLRCVKE